MNAWRFVWRSVQWAARVVWQDLFGEDHLTSDAPQAPTGPSIQLGPIQAQLDGLAAELAQLEERRGQSQAELARLEAELAAQGQAIDQALLSGGEDLARRLALARIERLKHYEALSQHCLEQARLADSARRLLAEMHERVLQNQNRLVDLAAREKEALLFEHLAAAQHELNSAVQTLERKVEHEPIQPLKPHA